MLAMPIGSVNLDLLVELEPTVTPEGMPPQAPTMLEITRRSYESSTGQASESSLACLVRSTYDKLRKTR